MKGRKGVKGIKGEGVKGEGVKGEGVKGEGVKVMVYNCGFRVYYTNIFL